ERPPGALLDHVPADDLPEVEDLCDVLLEVLLPFFRSDVFDQAPRRLADDVDADVDTTEQTCCFVHGALNLDSVGHVGHDRKRLAAYGFDLGDDALCPALVDVDAGHGRPGLGELQGALPSVPRPLRDEARTRDD